MSSTQGLMIISKAGEGSGSRAVKFKLLPALGRALLSSPSQCSTALLGEVRLAMAPAPLPDSICCPWESLCLIHANPSPGLHGPNSAAPGAPLGPALSPLLAPHGLRVSLCLGICLNLTQKCSGTTSVPAVPLASSGCPQDCCALAGLQVKSRSWYIPASGVTGWMKCPWEFCLQNSLKGEAAQ